jgi:hypothetical protein
MAEDADLDPANFSNPFDYYRAQHDWLSLRFSWHEQHFNERFLDLSGFIHSISGALEPERLDYTKHSFPLGFFEVEQPTRIRYATVVFLFTIYERRTRALCSLIDEVTPIKGAALDELRGTFSDRVKDFLRARISVDPSDLPAWERLQTVQKVRDCIVHCGGRVSESRDEVFLRRVTATGIGLATSPWDYLYIDEAFCDFVEQALHDFLGTLLPQAHEVIRERWLAQPDHERVPPTRGAT